MRVSGAAIPAVGAPAWFRARRRGTCRAVTDAPSSPDDHDPPDEDEPESDTPPEPGDPGTPTGTPAET